MSFNPTDHMAVADALTEAIRRRNVAENKLSMIRQLHVPHPHSDPDFCQACATSYPCLTVRILDGDSHGNADA